MHTLKVLILFVSLNIFAQEAEISLSPEEIENFQAEMKEKAEKLETLSADFVQSKHLEMMENEAQSQGKVFFKTPELLKWEYQEPYDFIVLFKDGQLYINDEGHKSVTNTKSNKLFEKLGKLVSGSVNGNLLQDNENFEISYFKNDHKIVARVQPKEERLSAMFNEILLYFNDENLVERVELKEKSGDYTHIKFTNVRLNEPISSEVFEQ